MPFNRILLALGSRFSPHSLLDAANIGQVRALCRMSSPLPFYRGEQQADYTTFGPRHPKRRRPQVLMYMQYLLPGDELYGNHFQHLPDVRR